MSLRRPLFMICLLISVGCLTAGYWMAGEWIGAIVAFLMGPAWLFARKKTNPWLPFICLLATVGLAAAGRLFGTIPWLMILSSAFALAVWDLLSLDAALTNHSFGEPTRRYEDRHIQSLAVALGFGLIVVVLGRSINFQFPLIILAVLIVFTLFAMERIWGYIKSTGKL